MGQATFDVVLVREGKMAEFNAYWNSREKSNTSPPDGISKSVVIKASSEVEAESIAEKQHPGWTAVRSITNRLGKN